MTNPSWFLGTIAWSYEDWKGNFYPNHLAHTQWLSFYSSHFNAVEVDSTFYHVPTENALKNWLQKTPDSFLFCAKAPRRITHELRLRESEKEIENFLQSLSHLGNKLGKILFQFPSSFTSASSRIFFHFLQNLPQNFSYAVEFRDKSWNAPRFDELLHQYNITRVWNDTEKIGGAGAFLHREQTSDDIYVRLLGDITHKYDISGKVIHTYTQTQWPRNQELDAWVARLKSIEKVNRIFIFSANHYEGFAPETAKRLGEKLGFSYAKPEKNRMPIQQEFWS